MLTRALMLEFDRLKQENQRQALHIKYLEGRVQKLSDVLRRWVDIAVMWQGKHAILRHENNQLRRKLYRQEKVAK